jgi:N-acetylneuraminate synthase
MLDFARHLQTWTPHLGRCWVVGEIAQAHEGSLGMAHSFIDAIAEAGADAVKFQTHIAAAESTPAEPWRVKFSPQDSSRYDYWKRMEFTEEQWRGLKEHASERRLMFLSSPFSLEAVELLNRLDVAAWKVASGEVTSAAMFERMTATGRPFILSTGMSPWSEIHSAIERVRAAKRPFALLQCTSAYPCPPEKIGLNLLSEFHDRYGCPVGLSDHSGTIYPGLAAAAQGCALLEVHVTFSRKMFGPDVVASLTTAELKQLVEGVRFIEKMRSNPVDKDRQAEELAPLRRLFTKSIVARTDLPAGTVLAHSHLAFKKPGDGLPEDKAPEIIGKRLKTPVARDQQIHPGDCVP